eukprot:UN23013
MECTRSTDNEEDVQSTGEYFILPPGRMCHSSQLITSPTECRDALAKLGITSTISTPFRNVHSSNYPSACSIKHAAGNELYFNTWAWDDVSQNYDMNSICKYSGGNIFDSQSCKIQGESASVGTLSDAPESFTKTVDVSDGFLAITGSWEENAFSECDAVSDLEITRKDHDAEYFPTGVGITNGCAWSSLWGSSQSGFTHKKCKEECNSDFGCTGYMYSEGSCDLNSISMTDCPRSAEPCDTSQGYCQFARSEYIVTVNTGCAGGTDGVVTLQDPQLARLRCPSIVDQNNWYSDVTNSHTFKFEQIGTTMTVTRTDLSQSWCMDLKVRCFHSDIYK